VVNNTYCNNNEFCPGIDGHYVYLPLVVGSSGSSAVGASEFPADPLLDWDSEFQILQRLVANGMLMVNVQPKDGSITPYDPGDPITTNGSIDIYLGPGTNFAVLDSIDGTGSIVGSLNDLGGVWAKGSYWWKVDFEGDDNNVVDGWVRESDISPQLKLRKYR
jgi:hypothetical protein